MTDAEVIQAKSVPQILSNSNIARLVNIARNMGFAWDLYTIGIRQNENGHWNINVDVIDEDGFRKQHYGFLRFDCANDAIQAKREMSICL